MDLAVGRRRAEELYDLEKDPQELKNLALIGDFKKTLDQYRQMAIKELKRTKAPFVGNLPRPSTLR